MTTTTDILTTTTNIKQNLTGTDSDEDLQTLIFSSNIYVINKINRINVDGSEVAVIVPFNTFYEPFHSEDDIDTTESTAIFDSTNKQYKMYSDINGNYKYLQSKCITWQNNYSLESILCTVYAEYLDGSDASNGIDIFLYNGNEWIPIINNVRLYLIDYSGSDLDADLDADLGANYSNLDSSGAIVFQNKIKYKIIRTSESEVDIKKIIIKFSWRN
jgi:hypothetical protein